MKLSADGRVRIQNYEGYHEALPDGSCKAYRQIYHGHFDKWTIGWGSTEGVHEGLIWTRAQAEEAFDKEISKFESAVDRLVTVDLNQNEFDALVSFTYNVGIAAFQGSTLLKKLNAGDRKGAAAQFARWNRAGGGVVKGLVQRRASEMDLFLKPVAPEPKPAMPQTVTASKEPPSRVKVAVATASTAIAAGQVVPPAVPDTITQTVGNLQTWKTVGDQAWTFKDWLVTQPFIAVGLLLALGLIWWHPWDRETG